MVSFSNRGVKVVEIYFINIYNVSSTMRALLFRIHWYLGGGGIVCA